MESGTQEGLEGGASHGAGDARRARSEKRRRTVAQEQLQDTEATIAALLAENRVFPPPPEFAARAVVQDRSIYERAEADPTVVKSIREATAAGKDEE